MKRVQFATAAIAISLSIFIAGCNRQIASCYSTSGIYEGIEGYGTDDTSDRKEDFRFRFHLDGAKRTFRFNRDSTFALQNLLQEGSRYSINAQCNGTISDLHKITPTAEGKITAIDKKRIEIDGKSFPLAKKVQYLTITRKAGGSHTKRISKPGIGETAKIYGKPVRFVDLTFVATPYVPPVAPTPGLRTLKNFLTTALLPCGTTLYVYGGNWNWQDSASGHQATEIGIPKEWIEFFQMNDKSSDYKNPTPGKSYYPFNGYNEYHYLGSDCSGFVGWTIYNTFNTRTGGAGYVMSSSKMARTLGEKYRYGTYNPSVKIEDFLPGDIMSMDGHVWICLGKASDGSLLIIHSTVNRSMGSGIQLSGIGKDENCKAVAIAKEYMKKYWPQWSERYEAVWKDPAI